jgi:uncharacterized protein YrzB (UPF0473 family)
MSEDFGSDFVTIIDDEGNEFELEVIESMDYNGHSYMAFLPADMSEDDPDYGFIILKCVQDGDEELLDSVDDEELLEKVYAVFMEELFDDEEDADE